MSTCFETFWNWLQPDNEHVIRTLGGGSYLHAWHDAEYMIIESSHGKRYKRKKETVEKDFDRHKEDPQWKPKGDARWVLATIVHWKRKAPAVSSSGSQMSPPTKASKPKVAPNEPFGDPCVCLCVLCREFLSKIAEGGVALTAAVYPEKWVKWAVWRSTIHRARAARGIPPIAQDARVQIAHRLEEFLSALPEAQSYADEWEHAIHQLVVLGLTLGEAQKVINLLAKYLYAFYFAEVDRNWMASNRWVAKFAPEYHIPIDQIVIENLGRKYPERITMSILSQTGFVGELAEHCEACTEVPWSGLECRTCYDIIQQDCTNMSRRDGFIHPLEFEMAELWRN